MPRRPPKKPPAPEAADPFRRDMPAKTLRAVAAAFLLAFDVLLPGSKMHHEREGFALLLRRTEAAQ